MTDAPGGPHTAPLVPAPPLHVTFGELVGDTVAVPRLWRDAVQTARPYARLGAIYHDLPYFIGVVPLCVGYWQEKALEITPWGVRLHRERPGAFAEHLVRTLRTTEGPLDRSQKLAFLAGFLSHAILDHTMHPLVNRVAVRQVELLGGEVTHHHRMVEKVHSMFFHLDRFGADVLGSHVMRERIRITDSRGVAPHLAAYMTDLVRAYFGFAPSPREWTRWVRCYQRVSWLLATYPAAHNSRRARTEEMRRRYYANEEYDFREFFAAAEQRTSATLSFVADYFDAADFSGRSQQQFVERIALDDLAFPDTLRHPEPRVVEFCARQARSDGTHTDSYDGGVRPLASIQAT